MKDRVNHNKYSDQERLQYSLNKSFDYLEEGLSQDYKEGYLAAINWVKNYVDRGKKRGNRHEI